MECYSRQSLIYFCLQEAQGREGSLKGYKLVTSVSIPVYNKKKHTVTPPTGRGYNVSKQEPPPAVSE